MTLFALLSILITLAALASYLNYRFIKLPTTIGVMLVTLVGSLALIVIGPYIGVHRGHAVMLVDRIDFNEVVLHGMLAFLLFAGSIHVHLDDLGRQWIPIGLLAVLGTLLSTFIVGGATYVLLNWIGVQIPF